MIELTGSRSTSHDLPIYPADGTLNEYAWGLPLFQEKTFVNLVGERVSLGEKVRFLDIGCGKGIALCELKQKFPSVEVTGLSLHDFREVLDDPYLTRIRQVDYQVGDAQDLGDIFRGREFDIIVSWYAFQYFPDPLAVLEQLPQLLTPTGVALIGGAIKASDMELVQLNNLWQTKGVKLESPTSSTSEAQNSFRNLIIRRTST